MQTAYQILKYSRHKKNSSVQQLNIHLSDEQFIYYSKIVNAEKLQCVFK